MKKVGVVFLSVLLVGVWAAVAFANAEDTANKKITNAATLKLMSTFLSNFSEQGIFDVKRFTIDDRIRFGIRHNYINNYKSRVAQCKVKNCPYGALTIKADHVFESIKKYLNADLATPFKKGEISYKYNEEDGFYLDQDAMLYHFEGADGEAVYYARVTEASTIVDDTGGKTYVEMTGYFYNVEDEKEKRGGFIAHAAPYKYGGKDTWYLIDLLQTD